MSAKVDIVVAAPIGVRTGGPEALHQLVHAANHMGVRAALWPTGRSRSNAPVKEYEGYECPILATRLIPPGSVLVAPEVAPAELLRHWRGPKWMWWLSVGNSPLPKAKRRTYEQLLEWENPCVGPDQTSTVYRLRDLARAHQQSLAAQCAILPRINHMCQSHYAMDFCRSTLRVNPILVTDYLRVSAKIESVRERNRVAYNPQKAQIVVDHLKTLLPSVNFVGLSGMSGDQVSDCLQSSALYLEAGPMPGNDRLPREAALVGTPVVALRRGAAAHSGDLPIPARYLISPGVDWLQRLAETIEHVCRSPEGASADQTEFRTWTTLAPERFKIQVRNWLDLALGG